MKKTTWKIFHYSFILWLTLAFLYGCATTPPQSPIDLSVMTTLSENEAVVFGRVKVLENNKPVNWGNCKDISFGVGRYIKCFEIFIRGQDSTKETFYFLSDDGSFYWQMPPGNYEIFYYKLISGVSYIKSTAHVRFVIPEGNPVVYIGTLTISMFHGISSIDDEFDQAIQGLRSKFPAIDAEPIKSLME